MKLKIQKTVRDLKSGEVFYEVPWAITYFEISPGEYAGYMNVDSSLPSDYHRYRGGTATVGLKRHEDYLEVITGEIEIGPEQIVGKESVPRGFFPEEGFGMILVR